MRALLINDQGCVFDEERFTNLKQAKEWAKGRGGDYQLRIMDDNGEYLLHRFSVKNDRFYRGWA